MKQNYRNRHLKLQDDDLSISRLEAFLDSICDDYRIYDDYYGNIISSVTEAFDLVTGMQQKNADVDIYFSSGKNGLVFRIILRDMFIDIARIQERIENNATGIPDEEWDEPTRSLFLINSLADNVVINNEDESLEILFHVTGINEFLTEQRRQLLYNYYDKLLREKKTYK